MTPKRVPPMKTEMSPIARRQRLGELSVGAWIDDPGQQHAERAVETGDRDAGPDAIGDAGVARP
jgi:hypothetical protein